MKIRTVDQDNAGFESRNLRRVASASILVSLLALPRTPRHRRPPSPLPSVSAATSGTEGSRVMH